MYVWLIKIYLKVIGDFLCIEKRGNRNGICASDNLNMNVSSWKSTTKKCYGPP
jgi:hypothetical protein